jgi:hypothetical protein
MQDDAVHAGWREGEDPELAIHIARDSLPKLLSSTDPIDIKIARLAIIAEPLLDAPGGNPMLLARGAKALITENAWLERSSRASAEQRLRRRVWLTTLQARGLHCGGESYYALRASLAALTAIQNQAEGRDALLARMPNRPPNIYAESVISVLGIAAASLRRTNIADTSYEKWAEWFKKLAENYIPELDPSLAYIYPGTPSLVQVLYMITERRDPGDAELVRALHALDKLSRPTDRRGQATIPLREVAVAGYFGDLERLAAQRKLVRPKLQEHPLPRHLDLVDRYLR